MPNIYQYIKILYSNKTWFKRDEKLDALKSIAELGSPFASSSIFQYIFSFNRKLSLHAADTVHILMQKVKPSQWTQLYPSFQNLKIYKHQLSFLSQFADSVAVDLLGIASLNGDGYIREAAIERLYTLTSPRKFAYILLRLGDWVPQVRQTAMSAISHFLQTGRAGEFMQYIYILEWMTRVERVDLAPVRKRIISAIISSSSQTLYETLNSPDWHVRYFSYQTLLSKEPDNQQLIEIGSKDFNSTIRWSVFQHICSISNTVKAQNISLFLHDPSPRISSSAMKVISDDQWEKFYDIVFQNIFHNSFCIRNTARYLLKEHDFDTFADEYRNRLESGTITPGIVSGLAETGNKDDFDLILACHLNIKPSVRSAAIAGLYRVDEVQSIPYLIEALKDSHSKVRRTSVSLLCKSRHFDNQSIRKIFNNERPESRISALHALCCKSNWELLNDILFLVTDPEETVRKVAWDKYAQWYLKRSVSNWAKPPKSVLNKIEKRIMELDSKQLPEHVLKYWKDLPNLIESGKKIWGY